MNKRLKAKWVRALRSGELAQGKGSLCEITFDEGKSHHAFCCLGVLAFVQGIPPLKMEDKSWLDEIDLLGSLAKDDSAADELQIQLAKFNDAGKSFKWIASWIERSRKL